MANITFEQFLQHTNAEEIIVQKMKEAGPRIYRINFDRRLKHCKVLYKKFYDVKLRDTVLTYGLVLKPMPNCFKAKFLQFPQKNNNEGENNCSDTAEIKPEQKYKNKSPNLDENYKDDLPCTSTAFVHKPRLISQHEKNKTHKKSKLEPDSQQQLNLKRDISSTKTYKIPTKPQKFSKKDHTITKYFTSKALNIKVDQQPNAIEVMNLRKRISDPPNENIGIEPRLKRPKISAVKKIETKKRPEIIKSKIGTLSSKRNSIDIIKKRNKCDRKKTSINKSGTVGRTRLYSDDIVSDDCDINSNNSVVNLTSEDSREHILQSSPSRKFENNSSPSKSALPKRNRTEDYGKTSNEISKKLLEEISPEKPKNGFTKNQIKLWIMEGEKALEVNRENNKSPCRGRRPVREDVSVGNKLQTLKRIPEKVKKHIKYWLKFEIQMRKGINLEATVVSETSRAKILSAFDQMKFEDFKHLINVQSYISHWTQLGASTEELEQNFKNHYTSFIRKEKSWPDAHIELAKLQSFLHSKGTKGSIPLKNIPPRLLSFDEVLKITNLKEFISLNCNKPPESYKELLSLCKKEYEKCCCEGVWIEELRFNDKKEESGSSSEMSIELFTEPSMPMSPHKISLDSGNSEQHVAQKELPVLQNLDNSASSYKVTSEPQIIAQDEFGEHSKNSTKVPTSKHRNSQKCGPKSRQKHSPRGDDDLEFRINHICGDGEEPMLRNTIEPTRSIDTQELNRILAYSQPPGMDNLITMSPNILACSDEANTKCSSIQMNNETSRTPPNVLPKEKPLPSCEMDELMTTTNNKSTDKLDRPSEKGNLIPASPNLFQSSGESDSKYVDSHLIGVQTLESVYVPCEFKNDFHTEQNNFSMSMNEASEDPFGETIANQEERVVIRLDLSPSCETEDNGKTNENSQIPIDELNIPQETSQINEKIMKDTIDLEYSITQKTIDSEETILPKQLLISLSVECSETGNNHKKRKETYSEKKSSNLSHEASDIVDSMNTNLDPGIYLNTDAVSLGKIAYNKENENSVIRAQSIEPTPDSNDVAANLKPVENAKDKLMEENLQSKQPERNHSKNNSVCFLKPVEIIKDLNMDGSQAASKLTSDHNSVSKRNTKESVENLETDLNASISAESIRNVKVIVKREIFSQPFSQYDDDVEIIEIPQSDAMVIEDEETAPELLEALLCSTAHTKRSPKTILNASISPVMSSSIYLDNIPEAQQLPSNFNLTQSQLNLNQSSNMSTNASPVKIYSQNVNKSTQPETATKSTDNVCGSSDCFEFKTTHNQAANLSCSANVVLKKSSSSHQATKGRKKTSDRKQKLATNKSYCSSKSEDGRQLSEEMSEMSYVSIAPQNIPSEIELTQISLHKSTNEKQKERFEMIPSFEESSKAMEKADKVSIQLRVNKQNTNSGDDVQESGESILLSVSDSFSGTNNTMNLELPKNIKSEEFLSSNKIPDLLTPKQRDMETFEKPGKVLSWFDLLNATKELKFVFEEILGIDEKDVGYKKVEQQPVASLTEDSLDKSRGVGLLQGSIENDIGVAVSVNISNNNKLAKNNKEHNKESSQYFSIFAKDIAQEQFQVSGDNVFVNDKDSSHNSGVIDVGVSKDKSLSIESKNYYEESSEHAAATPYQSEEDLNNIELLKEKNADSTAENAFSMSDSGDVELLEESEEEDDIGIDNTASLSKPLRGINNLSKSITDNEAQNTEVASKLRRPLSEEGIVRDKETVDESLCPKKALQTNAPIFHDLVSDTNTFQIFNFNEVNAETCGKAEDELVDSEHMNKIVKPIKACKVRIPKDNFFKAVEQNHSKTSPSTVQEMQSNIKGPTDAAECQLNKDVFLKTKEDFQKASRVVTYPEGSNSTIQSLTEFKCIEKESVLEKLSSKDAISNKKINSKLPSIDLNLQCNNERIKESKALQEQNFTYSTSSNTKQASEPIQIPEESCKNLGIRVRENVAMTSSTTFTTQHLGISTVVADNSSVHVSSNVEDNDFQLAPDVSPTKQTIQSAESKNQLYIHQKDVLGTLTVGHFKSSETSEDLSTKSSVSGEPKTNISEVSKGIVETTLPTKTSQLHSIRETQKDIIDEYIFPASSENKLPTENVDHVPKACNKIFPPPSLVINKPKNTSEDVTYSEFAIAITTSTQVELPVSDEKENEKENHIAAETSYGSSVEFIDFSFYYISSDDDNDKDNDDTKKEEKFSHTLNFTEALISKENIADASKAVNYLINKESLEKLNECSEFELPVNIPSTIQNRAMEVPKHSEDSKSTFDSKIIYNSNKPESSCNKSLRVACTNPGVSLNLNKPYHSMISNDSKTSITNENLLKILRKLRNAEATLCENTTATAVDLVKLIDKREEASKDIQQSNFEGNNTLSLNIGNALNNDNTNSSINTHLIDEQSSDKDQGLNSLGRNQCSSSNHSKNIKEPEEDVMRIKKNINRNIRRRTISEHKKSTSDPAIRFSFSQPSVALHSEAPQKSSKSNLQFLPHEKKQTVHDSRMPFNFSPQSEDNHTEVPKTSPKSVSQLLSQKSSQEVIDIPKHIFEPTITTKLKTITLEGCIPFAALQNIQSANEDFVKVPLMIEKRFLHILPLMSATSESIRVNVELKIDEQQRVCIENPNPEKEFTSQDGNNPSKKLQIRLGHKAKTKIPQPSTSKKKTTPKKSSKLPDFVQQKTHAFSSIPLKPCNKPHNSKAPSLLTVEECDYLIEDASQSTATTNASQILGTDCTYFENSELLRNLDGISHHPEVPELQIEQLPPQVLLPPPTTSKVINLIPITLSEGVTARKVWQVNLKWKSQKAMSIEVRFSVNRRTMTVCDESAKLLFTFAPEIWSDVHRVLREINHFEYKRRTLKNQRKSTSLHKVLRQLFDSATQVVDVKLINDSYNPFTICEKTIPVYRKPFQCLTKGIAPDILSKMLFLKENLQNNNFEVN